MSEIPIAELKLIHEAKVEIDKAVDKAKQEVQEAYKLIGNKVVQDFVDSHPELRNDVSILCHALKADKILTWMNALMPRKKARTTETPDK